MADDHPKNVLGEPLDSCSLAPRTGFTRSGSCETGPEDVGSHTVCTQVTAEFLAFAETTFPRPFHSSGFPG